MEINLAKKILPLKTTSFMTGIRNKKERNSAKEKNYLLLW